jgi:hypothetical protein
MHDRTTRDEFNAGKPKQPDPADYNTPSTTPPPTAPTTNTPGREINPPPHQYPKPPPVAGKNDAPQSTTNIDDVVTEASEESFPASDPPSSHRSE